MQRLVYCSLLATSVAILYPFFTLFLTITHTHTPRCIFIHLPAGGTTPHACSQEGLPGQAAAFCRVYDCILGLS